MKRSKHEPRAIATQKGIANHSDWMTLSTYPSHGRHYYRLQWGQGPNSLGQMHIPGGSVGNNQAKARAREVARWILQNRSRKDICNLIRGWAAESNRARRSRISAMSESRGHQLGLDMGSSEH
jgi:hypothetical protein